LSTLLPSLARHERSAALDGWRAVAILWVIASHALPPGSALAPLRGVGVHGVFIFFVLSGFLITTRLTDEEAAQKGVDLPAFYLRRAFRILPAALTYLGSVALLRAVGTLTSGSSRELLAATLFLTNYLGHSPQEAPYTAHFWSLAVEEHFYIFFPLLFAATGPRRLRWVSLVLCALGALWRWADEAWVHSQQLLLAVPPEFRTDHLFDLLLAGGALAVWVRVDAVRTALARALQPAVWCVLVAMLAWVVWQPPPFARTLEAALLALLMAGTALRADNLPARLLAWRPLAALGRISYSVYLWQQLFFVSSFRTPAWPQRFPVNLLLTLGCATLSYIAIEQPFLAFSARLLQRRAQRRSLAEAT
jgi:peptidoglycan/LPS O-acetylase OafA/YrhL